MEKKKLRMKKLHNESSIFHVNEQSVRSIDWLDHYNGQHAYICGQSVVDTLLCYSIARELCFFSSFKDQILMPKEGI